MEHLDQIKMNNRTYAGLTKGKVAPLLPNPPAIVWLSYNVHGNEPASCEAAMLTLYELIHPTNKETIEWLQHTVVIIDPCLNPDGRDRYVNWYNTTVGKNGNVDAQAREHFEGGGFAGAIGPQEAHYFAGRNRERDTVDCFDGAGLAHKQTFDGVAEACVALGDVVIFTEIGHRNRRGHGISLQFIETQQAASVLGLPCNSLRRSRLRLYRNTSNKRSTSARVL